MSSPSQERRPSLDLKVRMPSIRFLAIWTVLSERPVTDLETFSRWLAAYREGAAKPEAGPLERLMIATEKIPAEDAALLSDFIVAAIEARHTG